MANSFVHPDDAASVDAFNTVIGSRSPLRLVTSAWPQPWAGPINTARVLILSANPGWSAGDQRADKQLAPLLRDNLTGDNPMFWLDPAAAGTGGAKWVRSRFRRILEALPAKVAEDVVAGSVCMVEFHPYHSKRFAALPITLPTQRYTIDRVRTRIDDGAMVIITRAAREWKVAVPELLAKGAAVFTTKNPQTAYLTENNLTTRAWRTLMEKLSDRQAL